MWNVKNLLMLTQEQLLDAINQWYPTGTSERFLRMLDSEVQSITSMIIRANDLLSEEGDFIQIHAFVLCLPGGQCPVIRMTRHAARLGEIDRLGAVRIELDLVDTEHSSCISSG